MADDRPAGGEKPDRQPTLPERARALVWVAEHIAGFGQMGWIKGDAYRAAGPE